MSADENGSATRQINRKPGIEPPPGLQTSKPKCGIIMPISAIDDCDESHWAEVLQIIEDTISAADFEPALVSSADDVGVIQKRIIQNLYDNPVVVCDVSGKNPNVMFELGLRLAFDKPTIIIKDNRRSYSFDTAAIEHLEYPRDLRFSQINDFKASLEKKIKATYKKSQDDKSYTTFLKHYGQFKIAKIDEKEVPAQEYILEELKSLRSLILRMRMPERKRHLVPRPTSSKAFFDEQSENPSKMTTYISRPMTDRYLRILVEKLNTVAGVKEVNFFSDQEGVAISADIDPEAFDHENYHTIIHSR